MSTQNASPPPPNPLAMIPADPPAAPCGGPLTQADSEKAAVVEKSRLSESFTTTAWLSAPAPLLNSKAPLSTPATQLVGTGSRKLSSTPLLALVVASVAVKPEVSSSLRCITRPPARSTAGLFTVSTAGGALVTLPLELLTTTV